MEKAHTTKGRIIVAKDEPIFWHICIETNPSLSTAQELWPETLEKSKLD
jgi:hypothetical protein